VHDDVERIPWDNPEGLVFGPEPPPKEEKEKP
jgi:hypothetical protein